VTPLAPLFLAAAGASRAGGETAAAREQAGLCLELPRQRAVEPCRRALALGLSSARASVVRRALALKLIALERGTEAVEVYRDAVRAQPDDAEAHLRLGQALLSIVADAEAALPVLQRARELRPDDERMHGAAGLALSALARTAEAVSAFEAALRLDPDFFRSRPGAQRAYEAAQRGERWPPAITPTPPPP
jgi:tetratricopeptide (TPR) repeat protein